MRTGLLLLLLGMFLVARTVTKDSTNRNLVDRILGVPPGTGKATHSATGSTGGTGHPVKDAASNALKNANPLHKPDPHVTVSPVPPFITPHFGPLPAPDLTDLVPSIPHVNFP
jgi:hypothetical protein